MLIVLVSFTVLLIWQFYVFLHFLEDYSAYNTYCVENIYHFHSTYKTRMIVYWVRVTYEPKLFFLKRNGNAYRSFVLLFMLSVNIHIDQYATNTLVFVIACKDSMIILHAFSFPLKHTYTLVPHCTNDIYAAPLPYSSFVCAKFWNLSVKKNTFYFLVIALSRAIFQQRGI